MSLSPSLFSPAPSSCLDGLPDNVILLILSYLNLISLLFFSRVCRRFHHLSLDPSAWESVELTRESMGGKKLSALALKRIVRSHLKPCLRRVVLEETNLKGNAVVTDALLELLFSCCPRVQSITLLNCDTRKVCYNFFVLLLLLLLLLFAFCVCSCGLVCVCLLVFLFIACSCLPSCLFLVFDVTTMLTMLTLAK